MHAAPRSRQAVQTSPVATVQVSDAAPRMSSQALCRRVPGSRLRRRLLKLGVGRFRSVEVPVERSHRVARPVRIAFDAPGRRMEGAELGPP